MTSAPTAGRQDGQPATPVERRPAPLDDPTAQAVRELARRAAVHDGVAPLSEQPLLWLTDPEAPAEHLLVRGPEGGLDAYAQVDTGSRSQAKAELVVDPRARRHGVATALLDVALDVARAADAARLAVWAHGDLAAARAFADRTGFVVGRELWQMSLDLQLHAPDPAEVDRPLPAGVALRAFVPGQDEEVWRRANSRAFAHHPEQGRMTANDLRARQTEPWFDPDGFLLAFRDDHLLGFVWTKVHAAGELGPEPVGEIYVLGVDPDAQGLGLGGALTRRGLAHLASRGLRRAVLYTDASNTVAIRTYERAGFERSAVDVMFALDTHRSPSGATMVR